MSQAFHDFIRPGEHKLYAELDESLRCDLVEESLAASGSEDLSKTQLAVDKARNQAHRLLHKCTAELRRLQTDRQYRNETSAAGTDLSDLGLADYREIRKALDAKFRADYHREKFTGMADIDALLSTPIRPPSSFCKTQTAA
jgi:hypothetical protein